MRSARRRAPPAKSPGSRVARLLNEPTAAALAYGLRDLAAEQRIMVLDLGGGTFDVSILEMFEGVMEVRASAGDNFLGGEDFVDAIMDGFLAARGKEVRLPPRTREVRDVHAPLRRAAEVAKRALTDGNSHNLEFLHQDAPIRWTITRDEFERLSEPLLKRMRAPIERALRDATLLPQQIDHLVLAGGATRMPLVRRLVARLFQRLPIVPVNPDEVVGLGAPCRPAWRCATRRSTMVVMTDVAPFTMGIDVSEARNGQVVASGLYLPVIERNTTLPVSRQRSITTIVAGQTTLRVNVFQGEERLVKDNIRLGELVLSVPPGPAGDQPVEVRFTYDTSGLLEVDATVVKTRTTHRLVIENQPGMLSSAEIEAKLQAMAGLKVHPRDDAANRAVLARAERLYAERLGEVRMAVGGRSMNSVSSSMARSRARSSNIANGSSPARPDRYQLLFLRLGP